MRTQTGVSRGGKGSRRGRTIGSDKNVSDANTSNARTGSNLNLINRKENANRYQTPNNRQGVGTSNSRREIGGELDEIIEEINERILFADLRSGRNNDDQNGEFNEDFEYDDSTRSPVPVYRAPVQLHAARSSGSEGSSSTGAGSTT